MKPYLKVGLAALTIGAGIWIGATYNNTATGAGTTPGTTDDPVVTKSYVDQQIQQALNGGGGGSTNPTNPTNPTQPSQGADEVKNVALKPGKILIADAGTEFIVRSGSAVIY
ncbi:hypothetical protein GNF82_14710, partial [Clostridium perfringens]